MSNPAFNFAPFTRRAQPEYVDANDEDNDGFGQGDDAARKRAKQILDAFREANGEKPVSDPDDSQAVDAAAKAYTSASTHPQRVKAAADLIIAAGRATIEPR